MSNKKLKSANANPLKNNEWELYVTFDDDSTLKIDAIYSTLDDVVIEVRNKKLSELIVKVQ